MFTFGGLTGLILSSYYSNYTFLSFLWHSIQLAAILPSINAVQLPSIGLCWFMMVSIRWRTGLFCSDLRWRAGLWWFMMLYASISMSMIFISVSRCRWPHYIGAILVGTSRISYDDHALLGAILVGTSRISYSLNSLYRLPSFSINDELISRLDYLVLSITSLVKSCWNKGT